MGKKNRRKKTTCLNCHKKLDSEANFCPNCGQENNDKRVPVKHLFRDFMVDYLTFDSRFFRSLKPLLFKPGHLSKEFTHGKRQGYIQPLRLYLFISVLFFFTLGFLAKDNQKASTEDSTPNIRSGQLDLQYLNSAEGKASLDHLGEEQFLDSLELKGSFERIIGKKMIKLSKTGTSLNEYLIKNISIMMFFLLPVFALLLKLFFRKHKYYYVEHLVFALHVHAFCYLFFVFYVLLIVVLKMTTGLTLLVDIAPVIIIVGWLGYIIAAIHKFYKEGWWKTILKLLLILLSYIILLSAFLLATIFISILVF